jgi:hypothetical protein
MARVDLLRFLTVARSVLNRKSRFACSDMECGEEL